MSDVIVETSYYLERQLITSLGQHYKFTIAVTGVQVQRIGACARRRPV